MPIKILTHGDTDGVIAATLVSLFEEGKIFFTHPHGLLHDLNEFVDLGDKLYILDIALDEKTWRETLKELEKYGEKNKVIYIDHHPKPLEFRVGSLRNVLYINEEGRSTSELVHEYFKDILPLEASRLALYGAIGDYSDETPYVRKLYSYWDKRMIYFEAGILSQALEASRGLHDFKREIIRELVRGKIPSQIPELVKRAVEMSKREEEMRIQLKNEMVVLRNIAYAIDPSGSPTRAARYLIGLSGKNIGVAIEKRRNIAIISVRARKDNIDLNIILRRLAPKHGGSGGGHPHAGGARIPLENLEKFIKELDEEVGSYLTHQRYPLHIAP